MEQHRRQFLKAFEQHRREFLKAFPEASNLDRALTSETNPTPLFFYLRPEAPDLKRSWIVLARLGAGIESTFNIRSEVLILFSPYEDLQRRSYNALTQKVPQDLVNYQRETFGSERFTPDPSVMLLWSPDPQTPEKLETWNADSSHTQVAPMPDLAQPAIQLEHALRASLTRVLSARDLYKGLSPVMGEDFIGRAEILRRLNSELRGGLSLGLFGLRRSGKTSVLLELQRRASDSSLLVVLTDLESIDDLSQLPRQIAEDLTDSLRSRRAVDDRIWIGSAEDQSVSDFAELSGRLKRVAEKNPNLSFVLAVDEVESLVPFLAEDANRVRTFLGALRKASQATNNLSLLFTGITTRFFDDSLLAPDIHNPLFGFVEPLYLSSFSLEETTNLLDGLGRRMLLSWSAAAVETVQGRTGGYPIFVRDLASSIREEVIAGGEQDSDGLFIVTSAVASEISQRWGDEAAQRWSKILEALEHHHLTMAEMLRSDEETLNEWLTVGTEAEAAAKALQRLGLVEDRGGRLSLSPSLRALQALGKPAQSTVDEFRTALERVEWLTTKAAEEEGPNLEFKSTARWNLMANQKSADIEWAVVKTVVGFLNASGGMLLIGVSDDHEIVGIAEDLKLCQGSRDKFRTWLEGALLGTRCGHDVIAERVRVELIEVGDRVVAAVEVSPHHEAVWADDRGSDRFYVRSGNRTQELTGKELVAYVGAHWT